jgi:serine/threonine protein kinase
MTERGLRLAAGRGMPMTVVSDAGSRTTLRMERERLGALRSCTRARTLLGRYALRRRIGEGRMAEVFLAADVRLEREVAVKVLRRELAFEPAHVERFRAEALALGRVDSLHVVPVYDLDLDGEDHFLVMRLVRGQSLAQVIAKQGALPRERTLAIAADVLAGVQALHTQGFVHGALGAERVLVESPGRALVGNLACGDRRADTREVGRLLLHMLTGTSPDAADEAGVCAHLDLVDPALAGVVRRALEPEIARRWTAGELAHALEVAGTVSPVTARARPRPAVRMPALVRA